MATSTQISNLALSQVPAGAITSLDENSVQGRVCKLWYSQVVGELLERVGPRLAIVRAALAVVATTDREADWAFRYTLPAGTAFPLRVLDAAGAGSTPYEFTGSYVYSNEPDAIIEYVTTAELGAEHNALFKAALIAQLAARICLNITKDQKRTDYLQKAAEVAIERATAFNINLGQPSYFDHIPDIVLERWGENGLSRRGQDPVTVYPDPDYISVFEGEL